MTLSQKLLHLAFSTVDFDPFAIGREMSDQPELGKYAHILPVNYRLFMGNFYQLGDKGTAPSSCTHLPDVTKSG